MSQTDEPEVAESQVTHSDYAWCVHCERTYKVGEHRKVKPKKAFRGLVSDVEFLELCAYEDCDGDAYLDARSWGELSAMRGYPAIPEHGIFYPLYP